MKFWIKAVFNPFPIGVALERDPTPERALEFAGVILVAPKIGCVIGTQWMRSRVVNILQYVDSLTQ